MDLVFGMLLLLYYCVRMGVCLCVCVCVCEYVCVCVYIYVMHVRSHG